MQASRHTFRLSDLVQKFGGSFTGNPDQQVSGFATLENADASQLAFLNNPKYRNQLAASHAAAILIAPKDAAELLELQELSERLWVIDHPYVQFARIAQYFQATHEAGRPIGIHPTAVVDPSAQIATTAWIGPQVVVGAAAVIGEHAQIGAACVLGDGVAVGAHTRLYPRVTMYAGCSIGTSGIIHSGAVIGADGFGFANDGSQWVKIPQTGRVVIGDDVEIGANTTIDRGALDDTIIGNDVKLDNQIQVGHNVQIGDHTAMAGCVAIAGSTVFGKRCQIGGGALIVGHIKLADDVHVSAATLVTHSIHQAGQYTGAYPFSDHAAWEKNAAALRNLNGLRQRVRSLEQQLKSQPGTPSSTSSSAASNSSADNNS